MSRRALVWCKRVIREDEGSLGAYFLNGVGEYADTALCDKAE